MDRSRSQPDPDDLELVQRAQQGDPNAFGLLVQRYQDRVYNTIYRMCHHSADALDLTQTTFMRALEALPRFEARAGVFTWLYRIAVNLTISHRRSQMRKATLSIDDHDDEAPRREPQDRSAVGPGEALETREDVGRLETALAMLDEEFRSAVVLKDIEGLDYATISDVLGVPVGTVKSRIHRGRSTLREILIGMEKTA